MKYDSKKAIRKRDDKKIRVPEVESVQMQNPI